MTDPYSSLLAATISMSPQASGAVITMDGVGYPIGATWYRAEHEEELGDEETFVMRSRIRFPIASVPRQPAFKDSVLIEGRQLYVQKAVPKGPVYIVDLSVSPRGH